MGHPGHGHNGPSPTADLEIHVSAEMLTDPDHARRLANCFRAIRDHEAKAGEDVHARFIDALIGSLLHYGDELQRVHDEVVRLTTRDWFEDES